MDEDHLRELLWESIPPPAQTVSSVTLGVRNALAAGGRGRGGDDAAGAGARGKKPPPAGDLMVMGFPLRLPKGGEALCACHGLLRKGGYICPRCGSKLCDVPTDCEVCGLMVVSSPHLARRYVLIALVFARKSWAKPSQKRKEGTLILAVSGSSFPLPTTTHCHWKQQVTSMSSSRHAQGAMLISHL